MFLGIIIALIVGFTVVMFCGGALKKVLEIVSFLVRLGLGGVASMLIYRAVGGDFSNQGRAFLIICIGAIIIFALIACLASHFRMVGYSINFFTNSVLLGLLVTALGDKLPMSMGLFAAVLFFLPRTLWVSDRSATTSDYCGSDYDAWLNVKTYFYSIRPVDRWEDSGDSWKCLPVQLPICALFYLAGSTTLFSIFPLEPEWLEVTLTFVAMAINVLFDLFVFRKIEERVFG